MIEGSNDIWYHQKARIIEHIKIIGEGSSVHKKALEGYRQEQKLQNEKKGIVENIFRTAITDIKLGASGLKLETLFAFLSECGVNIGDIGHSRKHLPDIRYCLENALDKSIAEFLHEPLPSTKIPPFYWTTCDKATPARTTNQAILIVPKDRTGTPCPICT